MAEFSERERLEFMTLRGGSETDAAQLYINLHRGSLLSLLVIGGAAVVGGLAGYLVTKYVFQWRLGPVPIVASIGGAIMIAAGVWAPIAFAGRASLLVGGISMIHGGVHGEEE